MKILSIGNSFSQDAQRYLNKVSGGKIYCVNLYIGGCPLRNHYENMINNEEKYDLEVCGERTGKVITIADAVKLQSWDVITLQQASHESFDVNNYTPFIEEMAKYLRESCPSAKIMVHHTWGYETGSERIASVNYDTFDNMSADIKTAYAEAAKRINADGIIPCGDTALNLYKMGLAPHRDTFHIDLGYGRYALALTWYGYLTGKDISENGFNDFDVPVTEEEIRIAKEAACLALKG